MREAGLKLILIVAGAVLGLTFAEIAVRIAGLGPPEVRCYDSIRGWVLKPGAIARQRSEGHARVSINHGGFRGPEVAIAKPSNVVRIAVVGDSFAEAMQVPYEDCFSAVAERELARCPLGGKRVQVLDFGVSGYGTAQELLTLREQAWPYEPDVVLLAFFVGNDLSDNSAALDTESYLNGEVCRPHYTLREGSVAENDEFRDGLLSQFWCRSVFALNRLAIMDYLGEPAVILQRRASAPGSIAGIPGHEAGLDDEIYGPPRTAQWREAWTVTEDLIAAMNRESRAHGARFIVVTLSTPIQVYPDAAYRDAYLKAVGGADLFYPEHRIDALGARDGFPVLNLAPSLQTYADHHHVFVHGFASRRIGTGHWNALGHRIAGELIARRLCELMHQPAAPGIK